MPFPILLLHLALLLHIAQGTTQAPQTPPHPDVTDRNTQPPSDCAQHRHAVRTAADIVLKKMAALEEAQDDFDMLKDAYYRKDARAKLHAGRKRLTEIRMQARELQRKRALGEDGDKRECDVGKELKELKSEFDDVVRVVREERGKLNELKKKVFLAGLDVFVRRGEKAKAIRDDFLGEEVLKDCMEEE